MKIGVSILLMAAVMMPVSAQNETAVTTQATAEAATLPDAAPVDGGATEDDATPTGETPSEDPPADDTTEGAVENLPEENGDETPTATVDSQTAAATGNETDPNSAAAAIEFSILTVFSALLINLN